MARRGVVSPGVVGGRLQGNPSFSAKWGAGKSSAKLYLKRKPLVTFHSENYLQALDRKINIVSLRLQKELMEEIKAGVLDAVVGANIWPATIYGGSKIGSKNTLMFDYSRLMEVADTVVAIGESVKEAGSKVMRRNYTVKALGENRNIDSVGIYYEFGTGEGNEAPSAIASLSTFRSNNWGKEIQGRKRGTWTDIGGNKRWASGAMEGEDLPYEIAPKRWFRRPMKEVFDRCIVEYSKAIREINPLGYVSVAKNYTLGKSY